MDGCLDESTKGIRGMTAAQRRAFDKFMKEWGSPHAETCKGYQQIFKAGWNAAPAPPKWSPHRPTEKGLYVYKVSIGAQGVTVLIQEDKDGLYTRGFGLMPVEPAVVHRVYRPRSWPDGFWYPVQECGSSTTDF